MTAIMMLLIVVFQLNDGSAKQIPSFAGPYRLIFGRSTNQTDEFKSTGKIWFTFRATHPRIHSPQYAWGFEENVIEVNDKLYVEVRISKWSNNQWKRNAFVMKFPCPCSAGLIHAPSLMRLFFGQEKCPVEPGSRIITNQTVNVTFPNVPVFPYGRWLYTLAFFMGKEVVGAHSTELDVVPKV